MNRQQKVQKAVILLLTLLCGVCAGMLFPCQSCRTRESVAAFSYAAVPLIESAVPSAGGGPSAGAHVSPAPAPTPTPQNLFAIEAVPTASPAPESTPSPAAGFAIEVLHSQTESPRKRVLIYHSHTYEAYEQTADDPYQETEQWRTADSAHNVVRVGEELAGLLRGLGMDVVHDVTAFEPPNLSSAYTRSLQMLERRRDGGERFDLYIDLHRDAYTTSQTGANSVNIGGSEVAKLMLLIGKGEGQTTQGFAEKPDWEANLTIAQMITDSVNTQASGLCKNVRLKSGRFNQHIATGCMLVEAGNNRNTLAEALAAMPYLADAIMEALK